MKRIYFVPAIAALALGAVALPALAKDKGMYHGHRGGMQLDFDKADADGDGMLSQDELEAHARARFLESDTDGNGSVSAEEMQARMLERMKERAERRTAGMIERHDKNGDGELSFDEMRRDSRRADRMFDMLDADNDDMVSRDELAEMRERRGGRHGMKRHGGDGHGYHMRGRDKD
ncbi:Ca2+-binding protein, EF-hand superfamily [Salinihabitans flavidus]|uniref:Ca2+-binding protein, EF-hand superfamily n=1 Tax=Salinihabitans flavidus TaxID=569882 RepID=A0A1H8TRV1_9RHOB|nr:EF-hand domain-containing protein [Salinihabitans flavidus]SEO93168.1 Ca2+-binding protein, EF-hand superfamily [Salinihabitans flavidus]